jgi:hypothetical protein
MFEAGTFARIHEVHDFGAAVEALGSLGPDGTGLSALSAEFCRMILANPDVFAVPLVHTVTPIAAIRTLTPYLPDTTSKQVAAQLWQVGAAITIAFTPRMEKRSPVECEPVSPDELLARAAEHGDPHVIKFSDACVREHALRPDPAYIAAADHVAHQVSAWSGMRAGVSSRT